LTSLIFYIIIRIIRREKMGRKSEEKEKPSGWLMPRDERERHLRQYLNILAQIQGKRTRDLLYDALEEYIKRHRQEIKI